MNSDRAIEKTRRAVGRAQLEIAGAIQDLMSHAREVRSVPWLLQDLGNAHATLMKCGTQIRDIDKELKRR